MGDQAHDNGSESARCETEQHEGREAVLVLNGGRTYCGECAARWASHVEGKWRRAKRERDEARAEVERLRAERDAAVDNLRARDRRRDREEPFGLT